MSAPDRSISIPDGLMRQPYAPTGQALAQIKEKGSGERYHHLGRPIHLIGMEFSKAERNKVAFEVAQAA